MRRLFFVALLAASFSVQAERPARVTVLDGDNIAYNLVVVSTRGEEIAATDPRVRKAQEWLTKAIQASGEDDKAVAAQCERTARWFFDMTRQKANALEMLEALAQLGKAGTPMQDTLRDYVAARRQTAGKTHAEALAALGIKG